VNCVFFVTDELMDLIQLSSKFVQFLISSVVFTFPERALLISKVSIALFSLKAGLQLCKLLLKRNAFAFAVQQSPM
jgi:hypothetical protein